MKQHFTPSICFVLLLLQGCQFEEGAYVCTPCDQTCDQLTFSKPGFCPHCNMPLIPKKEIFPIHPIGEIALHQGAGVLLFRGGIGHEKDTISVFYYLPEGFDENGNVLLVIPGAGRNGASYRGDWVEVAERSKVLVLSLAYPENSYPFEAYHLGGIVKSSNLPEIVAFEENSNVARIDEEALEMTFNTNPGQWLFKDFDRIFDQIIAKLGTGQERYDIFGHSAGGQILHRMALFSTESKADRIIAANAGFYTLSDMESAFPFGMSGEAFPDLDLIAAFQKKLIILVGALDNESETGGTLLRSQSADLQGTHRLARGKYFFEMAKLQADRQEVPLNWSLIVVPGVGHDHSGMSQFAEKLLY